MLRIMSLMLVPTYAQQYQPPPSNYFPSTTNTNSGLVFDANTGNYVNSETSFSSVAPVQTSLGGTTFSYNPATSSFETVSSGSSSSGLSSLLGNNMNYLPSSGMTSMGASPQMGGMNPMMNPMMGLHSPMGGMNPMMGFHSPMGGMNPMMGLHSPMGGMNPMMNPMMGLHSPMGGMNPMMGLHSPMGGMNPMMGLHSPMGGMNPMPPQFAPMSGSPFQSSNTFIPDAASPYATSVFGQNAGFGGIGNFAPLPSEGTSSTPSFGTPSIGFGPSFGSSMMGGYGRPMGGYGGYGGGFPPFGGYGGSYGRPPPMGGYGGYGGGFPPFGGYGGYGGGFPPMGGYGAGGYGFQSPQSMFSSSPMIGGYGSSMFPPMRGYGAYSGR